MMLHGGQFHVYYSRSKTTHIITNNLPNSKIQELKEQKVIRPDWITDRCTSLNFIPCTGRTLESHLLQRVRSLLICKPDGMVMCGESPTYRPPLFVIT